VRLVKQTAYGECACACLAMILGRSLLSVVAEVRDRIGPENLAAGMTTTEVVDHLARHGKRAAITKFWDGSRPAILVVPSLNHDVHHAIVWDGERFLDPGQGPLLYPADADPRPAVKVAIVWDAGREEVRS
jgi:hypothetical protein